MRVISFEILAITALFVNYVAGDKKGQNKPDTSTEIPSSGSMEAPVESSRRTDVSVPDKAFQKIDFWISRMGPIQDDLLNIQAIVVKDEETKAECNRTDNKSHKRYLMCGGSILSRYHVLTSATCLHDTTHIRHNVKGFLSVVIAPLTSTPQLIKVANYNIHPLHTRNPYSRQHLKHNVAILKLACRINTENFQKIELPRIPMTQICSEESCIVAVFRKTGRVNHAMFQIFAPNIPVLDRRRKEILLRDEEVQRSTSYGRTKMIEGPFRHDRSKRKLSQPPIFTSGYNSGMTISNVTSRSTPGPMTQDTSIEPASVLPGGNNLTSSSETSLYDDLSKILRGRDVGNETVRSFVVRSSEAKRPCAHTGSPVMFKGIQPALVAIQCDPRQTSSKWRYTDLFDNLDWIHEMLHDRDPLLEKAGNGTGCSTCIFNFFIEIGCKDKKRCGKNGAGLSKSEPDEFLEAETRSRNSDCSGGKSTGSVPGVGQDCKKTGRRSDSRPEYRRKLAKSVDAQIDGPEDRKHLARDVTDDVAQVEQPVTGGLGKTGPRNYIVDEEKYPSKDQSRLSAISQSYVAPTVVDSHRDRVTNEIGLQNIEGESSDWLSEMEKGLEHSSQFRREIVESRRSNIE